MKLNPITQAIGPVTKLSDIVEVMGVDALVRAVHGGLPVYDTGNLLMADLAAVELLVRAKAPGTRASPNESP
jgi:hypothetical protein